MTLENQAKLLQADKFAIEAGQDGIADLIVGVILGEMEREKPSVTFRDGGISIGGGIAQPLVVPTYDNLNRATCKATWTNEDGMRGATS